MFNSIIEDWRIVGNSILLALDESMPMAELIKWLHNRDYLHKFRKKYAKKNIKRYIDFYWI